MCTTSTFMADFAGNNVLVLVRVLVVHTFIVGPYGRLVIPSPRLHLLDCPILCTCHVWGTASESCTSTGRNNDTSSSEHCDLQRSVRINSITITVLIQIHCNKD